MIEILSGFTLVQRESHFTRAGSKREANAQASLHYSHSLRQNEGTVGERSET